MMTYFGKSFSILGDSISTLQGYQPRSYVVQYKGYARERSGVLDMEDTWWGMVIRHFGGSLLINDSYSGSRVTRRRPGASLYPSACCEERLSALAAAGRPDVLMLFLGANDWDACAQLWPSSGEEHWADTFEGAYGYLLSALTERFPGTELWCLNITCSQALPKEYPQEYLDRIELYNQVIAERAEAAHAHLVDLYTMADGYTSYDLAHPDRDGMVRIASAVIREMEAEAARK